MEKKKQPPFSLKIPRPHATHDVIPRNPLACSRRSDLNAWNRPGTLITGSHQLSVEETNEQLLKTSDTKHYESQSGYTASPPSLFTLADGLTTDMIPSSVVIHVPIRFSPRCRSENIWLCLLYTNI